MGKLAELTGLGLNPELAKRLQNYLSEVSTGIQVYNETVDGADNQRTEISGGGAINNNRGAFLRLAGNEDTNAGSADLFAGNATSALVRLRAPGTSGTIQFRTGSDTARWNITSAGDMSNDATNGGNVVLNKLGTGIKLKEGSNAKSGVATLVAGTVTVSTTAVATGDRILLTRQSGAGTARGHLTVGTITNGTSFVITSQSAAAATETNDTSVIYWQIITPA